LQSGEDREEKAEEYQGDFGIDPAGSFNFAFFTPAVNLFFAC